MNPRSFQIPLEQSTSVSINIIHETINNNSEELEKIKKLVDENKKNGHKIPLIATVLLLFHNAENNTLKKSDLYSMMEKETINNKNTIISSPTERYCIINKKNYKSKIKDIIKKKKWFTKKLNENKEIEFTLNPGVVQSIAPRITSFFKVLAKNDYLFLNEEEDKEDEKDESKDEDKKEEKAEEKQEKQGKKMKKGKKGKKGRKSKKPKQENLEIAETEKKKEKEIAEERHVTEEKQQTQEKEVYNEKFIECKNNVINIKKEKEIEEKEEKIEDFEIIIEDDDDDDENKISCTKTEERIIMPNFEDQKIENNENNSDDQAAKYLNKKRKPKKNINKNQKNKTEKEEISSTNNENSLILENLDMTNQNEAKYLNEKVSTKDLIDKDSQNNTIDSIINFGETFLKLLKSKKLSELASKKIDCLKEGIKNKEKEIQSDAKYIEKIKQKEKEVNSVNTKDIENKINEIKKINEEYKEKRENLSSGQNVCDIPQIENDKKHDNNIFNENLEINGKMISDFSQIFNNCQNAGELLNMILIDETSENNIDKNIMNIKNVSFENNDKVNPKTDIRIEKNDKYSDGNYIDLFNEENPSKTNCNNALDTVDPNKNMNL